MTDHDPRLDLPSSTTPPVEGSQWMAVKIGVWVAALVLIVATAALFARIATDVAGGAPKLALPTINLESMIRNFEPQSAAPTITDPPASSHADPLIEGPEQVSDAGDAVTQPSWIIQPAADYPAEAARQEVEAGAVEMNCDVTPEGWLTSCRIVSEAPTGAGFADATLRSAQGARMEPRRVDGQPVATQVRYTTRYRLE